MKPASRKRVNEFEKTLIKISELGHGLRPEVIDWSNIGKNAVYMAKKAVSPKCECCGQVLEQKGPK